MDRFGEAQFNVAQSPAPPAPQPKVEEPKGPSDLEKLQQQFDKLSSGYEQLRSSKDAKINELSEQISLLSTTLKDQLTERPKAADVAQPQVQDTQSVDRFWSGYFGQDTPPPQQQHTSQPAAQEQTPSMEPKEIKKLVKEQVSQMVTKAQEDVVNNANTHQGLVERYKTDYGHLHHATNEVQAIWNSITQANPNMDPVARFDLAMKTAEQVLPRQQAQGSQVSPFGGGGQGAPTYSTPAPIGSQRMLNGLPVRDAREPAQGVNDYILERQAAHRRRMNGPGGR